MEALVEAYEATGDTRLLDELAFHINWLLERTGSARGISDEVRGAPQPAWGADRYTCGVYFVQATHTGILAYPMAWYATAVARDSSLSSREAEALRFLEAAHEATAVHDSQFARVSADESYLRWLSGVEAIGVCDGDDWPARANTEIPYNRQLALARAHLELSRALRLREDSRATDAQNRGSALARHFRRALRPVADRFEWDLWVGERSEDASHGAFDLRVANDFYRDGVVFTDDDLDRFVATFRWLTEEPSQVRSHLDESVEGEFDLGWQRAAPKLAALAVGDPAIHDVSREIYYEHEGDSLLARALLHRFRTDAHVYPATARSLSTSVEVDDPRGATQGRRAVGLYGPADRPFIDLAGASVSSCVELTFEHPQTGPLALRYRHTDRAIAGDSCADASCGDPPGIRVFVRNAASDPWVRVAVPVAETEYQRHIVTVDEPFSDVVVCRTGSPARNNLELAYVRVQGI